MHAATMQDAIAYAQAHEIDWSREVDDRWGIHLQEDPPWNRLFGPVHGRGPASGVVWQEGKQIAAWGEPGRADLTFSVAKMYLALLAGVAYDRGLIKLDETVGSRVPGIGFDGEHNGAITWRHLLTQTSEWEGECFGIPEQVDRYRVLNFGPKAAGRKGDARPLQAPGAYWEYNDVRINQLSLALLHVFRRPLPEVFREAIMRPCGASENWNWAGYDNAWVDIDGKRMQSVPGGTHWGGGVSISAEDQARIGQMMLDDGKVNGKPVLSAQWLAMMREPVALAPYYGFLIWLNTAHGIFANTPESSYFGFGAGGNFTWMEPERRLVVIARWLDAQHADAFFGRVLKAVEG